MKPVFGLADGNNFYVSCERVFNPYYRGKPTIILSNNDGCAVARSNEAKALGIKMGEPYFKIERQCDQQAIEVLSSNYALYADMSSRMMSVLSEYVPGIEVYSIDECFLDLTGMPGDLAVLGRKARAAVAQELGLPICVGIAPTMTLAKLANRLAKKSPKAGGVVDLAGHPDHIPVALRRVEVGDVWGVGRKYAKRLAGFNIRTAFDLAEMEPKWIRREFGVVLERTASELRGEVAHELETQLDDRKSCTCSRSFAGATTNIEDVVAVISEFAQTAAVRLRSEGMAAGHIQVYALTNRFRQDVVAGTLSASVRLNPATNDSGRIVRTALALARGCRSYPEGCEWTKAGVNLTDLCRADRIHQDLFSVVDTRKSDALMKALDAANSRYGRRAIGFGLAAGGDEAEWRMKREKLSPSWTTRWEDVPKVRA